MLAAMISKKATTPDEDFFQEERRRLQCPLYGCKRVYSDKDTLNSHVKDHQIHTQSLPGKTFHCSSVGCNSSFPSMQGLMEHGRTHYKPNMYFLCENCRAKLASYNNLLKHLNTCSKVAKTKAMMPAVQTNPDVNLATVPNLVPAANSDHNANPTPDSVPITPPVITGNPVANQQAPQQTETVPLPLLSQLDCLLPNPSIGFFSEPDTLMQALPELQNQNQQQALPQPQTQPHDQTQSPPQSQQQAEPEGLQEFPTPGSSPQASPGSNAVWKKNQDSVLEAEPNVSSPSPSSPPSPASPSSPAPPRGPRARTPRPKKKKNKNWINSFKVPWNKMTPTLRQAIAMEQRAGQSDRLQMVRAIVDAMRMHCTNPIRDECAHIAKKITEQHPKTFADVTDEGEVLGCGYTSLLNQIKTRSEHLNRISRNRGGKPGRSKKDTILTKSLVKPTAKGKPHSKNQAKRANNGNTPVRALRPKTKIEEDEEDDSDAPNATIIRHQSDGYGCINWQPTDLPEGETEDSLKEKRQTLVRLHKKTRPSAADRTAAADLMKKTYLKQRELINSRPPPMFSDIIEQWPYLFQKKHLCSHVETLTGVDVLSRMTEALQNKGGRVIVYFQNQRTKWKGEIKTQLQSLLAELEEESKTLQGQGLQDLRLTAAVLLLMTFFKEAWESLFILADVPTEHDKAEATKADVEAHLTIPDTPRLIMLGRSIMTASRWMLSLEGRVVMTLDSSDTFADAFAVLFASYYVFNMEYHETAASTLELAQRFLVRINLEGGRRCSAKQGVSKRTGKVVQRKAVPMNLHVNSFIRSLQDFESEASKSEGR